MLHSAQDTNDLEKSILEYYNENNGSETTDDIYIVVQNEKIDWHCYFTYLLFCTVVIIILIFVGIYFS